MGFKLSALAKWNRRERVRQFMSHVGNDVRLRRATKKSICISEYDSMSMNSYERQYLLPLFTPTLLKQLITRALEHEHRETDRYDKPPITYTEQVLTCYVPELLKRID